MTQVEVRLDLPAEVASRLGATQEAIAANAKQAVVLELLRAGRLSQGQAADALGVSRHELIDLMAEYDVPSGPATIEEYRQEIADAEDALRVRPRHGV
jgi:hypothetical protein